MNAQSRMLEIRRFFYEPKQLKSYMTTKDLKITINKVTFPEGVGTVYERFHVNNFKIEALTSELMILYGLKF